MFNPAENATLAMAKCDQGYLCDVCGEEVEDIRNSDLYLRFVTGELSSERLLATPERHIGCNPVMAQFILDPAFPPVFVEGDFDRRQFDPGETEARTRLITRGWQRLQEIAALAEPIPIAEYPLAEFRR